MKVELLRLRVNSARFCARRGAGLVLATACAAASPGAAQAANVSLERVDAPLLRKAIPGDDVVVREYPEPLPAESAADCRERRRFAVFMPIPEAQRTATTTHGHVYDFTVWLCHGGPLGTGQYRATLAAAEQMAQAMRGAQAAAGPDLQGAPFRIGARTGQAAVIFEMGHGVVVTPIAVIASQDEKLNLLAVLDDPHLGEPRHPPSIAAALALLTELVKLADRESIAAPPAAAASGPGTRDEADPEADFRRARAASSGDFRHARDLQLAFTLFQRSAGHGHTEAKYRLAQMIAAGAGTQKDEPRACRLYLELVATGHAAATDAAATCQLRGTGVPVDLERALDLYARAADSGSWLAAAKLAKIYCLGLFGAPRDEKTGGRWDAKVLALAPASVLINARSHATGCPPSIDLQW